MKFTTATALLAISASVASAAPAAFNPLVLPMFQAATTTTTPSVEQPSIILDSFTASSDSDKSTPVVVSILPVGQQNIFIPSGISIQRSVPTTIVSNGQTTVSNIATVSFLRFGPGPARFSPRTSSTPSSTVAAHTSTPVVQQLAAGSTSSGLPFTLHFGFQVQPSKSPSSSAASSSASSSTSRSAPSFVIPSYKTTVYSTLYAKPSTISVVVPKSTITSVVSIPGKMRTITQTVHRKPSAASSSPAKPLVSSSSTKESVTYQKTATSSTASSSSSTVSRPFTLHFGFVKQQSTLVTSVRPSTTAASSIASSATSSSTSSKAAGLPFTLHYGFPMQLTKSSSTASQTVKSTPTAASYTTTSFVKVTPIAAHTSDATATPTSTKKSYFGIF